MLLGLSAGLCETAVGVRRVGRSKLQLLPVAVTAAAVGAAGMQRVQGVAVQGGQIGGVKLPQEAAPFLQSVQAGFSLQP